MAKKANWQPLAQLAREANINRTTAFLAARRGAFNSQKWGRDWWADPVGFDKWRTTEHRPHSDRKFFENKTG